jgi:5'-phosphate synthase pdxT subunit
MAEQLTIGVLALQGDFARHRAALERCGGARAGGAAAGDDAAGGDASGVTSIEVRKPEQLDAVDGLVIPGGESTTLLKLMDVGNFVPALEKFHAAGKPIFGTCAGLILLARDVVNPRQFSLGFIDVGVERNAYGRQRESFETRGTARLGGGPVPLEMVFIRAPRIRRVGAGVDTLATHGDEPVMARQDDVLVATFHPELTDDTTVHRYFCEMVRRRRGERP